METVVPDGTGCRLVVLDGRKVIDKPIIAWRVGERAVPVTTEDLPAAWAIIDPSGAVVEHDGTRHASLGRYIASKGR